MFACQLWRLQLGGQQPGEGDPEAATPPTIAICLAEIHYRLKEHRSESVAKQ
jgi:hypothetical protein